MSIALGASDPAPFNSNFYFAAATIIPVLLLALGVQGRLIDDLTKAWLTTIGHRAKGGSAWNTAAWAFLTLALLAVLLMLGYAVNGELDAIGALYQNSPTDPAEVLGAVVVLTVAAVAIPFVTYARALIAANLVLIREVRRSPAEPQPESSAEAGITAAG